MASRERTTINVLVEEGLRKILLERGQRPETPFRLRDCSFGGQGLSAEFTDKAWDEIRAESYGARGGGIDD